jgi:hypothetical protein
MKRFVLSLVVVLCAASAASAADMVRGCYLKANGQLRVLIPPDTCRPSELPIQFATGEIQEQLNADVFDGKGQFLGTGPAENLYVPSLRVWVSIDLVSEIGELSTGDLYFESSDCTGQPLAEFKFFNRAFRCGGGGWTEVKYFSGGPEIQTWDGHIPLAKSYLQGQTGLCQDLTSVYEFGYGGVFTKAVPVVLPFTTPVAMPLKLAPPTVGTVPRRR